MRIGLVPAVVAVSVLGVCASAGASVSWSYFAGGDAAFNALTSSGALERTVAEGRIGNVTTTGTWEQGIWRQGGVSLQRQGQFSWTADAPVDWSFSYDGASTATFVLGGQTLEWDGVAGSFTDIFIRVRSTETSSIDLTNLDLVGFGLGIGDLSSAGGGADYIRITNDALFGPVTLNGTVNLDWTGTPPTNSSLAFQVKFTNVVPTPGSLALLAVGALGAARRRR